MASLRRQPLIVGNTIQVGVTVEFTIHGKQLHSAIVMAEAVCTTTDAFVVEPAVGGSGLVATPRALLLQL